METNLIKEKAMKRTIEQISLEHPVILSPYFHDLDSPSLLPAEKVEPIELSIDETALFVEWLFIPTWRSKAEEELQSIAQDAEGKPLLTTWMPLVTFRESFCSGGRNTQPEAMRTLMEKLRELTRGWRSCLVDTVDISGVLVLK